MFHVHIQIFKEILLEMKHDDRSKADVVVYCRELYQKNTARGLTSLRELCCVEFLEMMKIYTIQGIIQWSRIQSELMTQKIYIISKPFRHFLKYS